jgi:hypothetical protein
MTRLSLSSAWEETKRIFAKDGGLLIAVALAMLVLPSVVAGVVEPPIDSVPSVGGRLVAVVAALVGVIGQLAIVRLALGPSITVGQAIRHGVRRFPATLGALLLLLIAIAMILIPLMAVLLAAGVIAMPAAGQPPSPSFSLAALVLAIASLLLAVKFIMSIPVASAEEAGPLAILKRSWSLTKGRYWALLAVEALLLIAALALLIAAEMTGGVLARLVGGDVVPFSLSALIVALFTAVAQAAFTVLASVMLARIYVQLSGRGDTEVSVPSSGT